MVKALSKGAELDFHFGESSIHLKGKIARDITIGAIALVMGFVVAIIAYVKER